MTKRKEKLTPCEKCGLYKVCHTPKLRPFGQGQLKIAVVISKPLFGMDDAGTIGGGVEYKFLNAIFNKIGIDLEKDCWIIPVVSCRTPKDRMPKTNEINQCAERFNNFLEAYNPNVVILMGKEPFHAVIRPKISGRLTGTPYTDFYGQLIPDQDSGRYIMTTYSYEEMQQQTQYSDGNKSKPLYIRDSAIYKMWIDHLYKACSHWNKKVKIVDYISRCKTTEDIDIAIDMMMEAMSWENISFDYETNSIKCYREGSKILSVSISNGKVAYAFPFFNDVAFRRVFKRLMTNSSKKISHNTSFEYQWTKVKAGFFFSNPDYDTMIMAHCINSQKPTSLKYEVYHRLGVIGYDSAADKYIHSDPKEKEVYGDNAFNHLEECPLVDMLLYNALDSLFTYLIWEQHMQELDDFQMMGYKFLNESQVWLTKAQIQGFCLNKERYNEVASSLENTIKELEKEVLAFPVINLCEWEDGFNPNSGHHLRKLLYEVMQIKPRSYTETGEPSVDVEALEKINIPFTNKILEMRKYQKLFGTYIHQFGLEETDGMIHAFTYLNRADTFRSSMGSVNVQNLPKRDPEAKKTITSLVIPRKGRKLVGYDLKGAEVSVGACNSGDKNLISYVEDLTKDMHRQMAMKGFILEKDKVTSNIRKGMKNRLTFPMMYGSYYKQTAPDMYEFAKEVGMLDHLAEHGIKTYKQFEAHIKSIEDYFWGTMFPTHKKWMENQWTTYQKEGKISIPTGFYVYAPMRRNNTFNTPVQGSAYHCNQRTFNKLSQFIEEKNLQSIVLFQIHDAIYVDMVPEEEDLIDWAIWYYGTQEIKEEWQWLVTTLYYEKESGEVGGDWSTLKEVGLLGQDGRIAS